MFFYVVCQSPALKQLHYQVNVVINDDDLKQADDVIVLCIFKFAQITECCNLAAKQISRNFIIYFVQVDRFDCKFLFGIVVGAA